MTRLPRSTSSSLSLSLREDFFGLLEEAADRIPQILDHRFRLTPLSLHAAAEALTGPAEIDDPTLETRPFRYDPKAVESILDYLSRRRVRALVEITRNIEPFQLQLICQRFERIVGERQRQSADNLTLTIEDIGGEAALRNTLKEFYRRALAAVPGRRVRKAARRLCEDFLISPDRRRLSLEENEIKRQLRLPSETLRLLVSVRLLRCDSRADSIYYELSHDALIEPVLATTQALLRQARGLLLGALGLVAGGISWLVTIGLLVVSAVFFIGAVVKTNFAFFGFDSPPAWTKDINLEWPAFGALFLMLVGMVTFSEVIVSGGLRKIRRYLRPRRAELLEPAIAVEIDLLFGRSAVVGGCLWLFLSVVAVLYVLALLGSYLEVWSRLEGYPLFYERGPHLDMVAWVIAALALLLLGVDTVRWGYRRLRPFRPALRFIQPTAVQRRGRDLLFGCLRIVGGGIALLAVIFFATEVFIRAECMSYSQGILPDWVPAHWWSLTDMLETCQFNDKLDFIFDLGVAVIVGVGALAFAVNWLHRGVRAVLAFVGRGSGQSTEAELSLSSTLRESA